jgi:pimeloyl-ACP methyl ester carboxylesterase
MDTHPTTNATAPLPPKADSAVSGLEGFTHRYAEVNGTRIHYVMGGKGPAIVLLHGYPYNWALWRKMMPSLAQAGFSVIAPDLRGFGDSARPGTGYSKVNVAEDVRQIVQSHGFDSIHLVGTDIGTMVAYAYASRHPGEVRRLILAESLIPGFGLEELMNPATGGYWHFGFHAQVDVAEMLTAGREEAYLMPWLKWASTSKDAEEVALKLYLPYCRMPGSMRAGFKHYETMIEDGRENRAAFRARLKMPVLVLTGDQGIPQEQLLGCVRQVADNIEAELVPHSGHTFSEDNPAWSTERFVRFFGPA